MMRLWPFTMWEQDTPMVKHARQAVRDGFAVVFLHPGRKDPLCPLTSRDKQRVGIKHPCGVSHASTDEKWVVRTCVRLEREHGQINLGIAAHASGVVVIDADTPEQVETVQELLRQMGEVEALYGMQPTVSTPGSERNGVMVHSGGTHWYFNRQDGLELPMYPGEVALPGGAVMRWGNSYTVVPPSVRTEGSYVSRVEEIPDVPLGLVHVLQERVLARALRATEALSLYVNEPVVEWSVATPWHVLLEPQGWQFLGKLDHQCGCPVWRRPGEDTTSDRSAIAHENDCGIRQNYEGHGSLHVFSDNVPGPIGVRIAEGVRDFTKLQFVALVDHDGDDTAAQVALGLVPDYSDMADYLNRVSDDPDGTRSSGSSGSSGSSTNPDPDESDTPGSQTSSGSSTRDDASDPDDQSSASEDKKSGANEHSDDPFAKRMKRLSDEMFVEMAAREEATRRLAALRQRQSGRETPDEVWIPNFERFIEAFFADEDELGPSVLHRVDQRPLLYAGRVNGLCGRRGAGKTWLAILATKQVLESGGSVLYYDMEDQRRAWANRLRQIGCDIDRYVRERKAVWIKPGALPDDPTALIEVAEKFTLVVFDVMNRLISRLGGNVNDGNAETVWLYNNLFDPLADGGATVLVLDHPNKKGQRSDAEIEDLNPAGGAMRMNNASGLVIGMRVVRGFSLDRITKATAEQRPLVELVCLKDRSGVFAEGDVIGLMQGDMAVWGMELVINAPGEPATEEEDLAADVRLVGQRLLVKIRAVGAMTVGAMKEATTPVKRWMVEAAAGQLVDEKVLIKDDAGKYRIKEDS